PSYSTRDGAHHDADPKWRARVQAYTDRDDRKQSKSYGFKKKQSIMPLELVVSYHQGDKQGETYCKEIFAVQHPECCQAEQQIPGGAASDCRNQSNGKGTKPVYAFSRCETDTAYREGKGTQQVQ